MTWQIQSTSWISVANSTPSTGSGHRYDHMTRTWTAPTGASSLRGKTTQAILRVHGKYPHGKGQQVPSTSKGRKSGRQCIFCWAGHDGRIAPSCQEYWNHYCAFANLVPLWDYLIIIKRIIFLIQVGEMHWHAISVPKVASYTSANFELCTVHFLHLLHSAHIAQRTYCAIAQCQSISCTAHILHWLVAQLSSI